MGNINFLVVNAGSSSVKLALFQSEKGHKLSTSPIWKDDIELKEVKEAALPSAVSDAIESSLTKALTANAIPPFPQINGVGHRIVHGGSHFSDPVFLDNRVIKTIESLSTLAPLHNPLNLAGIHITEKLLPKAKQIAVFDTAFFTSMPESANTYPGPFTWKSEGIKRYGFHGISHHYNILRFSEMTGSKLDTQKIVSCHLGNGASLASVKNGKCIDTTMGFTPLDGLMMGTRPGTLDPGILTYLLINKNTSAEALFHQLNYDSGLKGISGISGDMRDILKGKENNEHRPKLAYEMFIHSLVKNIASMGASMNGIDAITFSGGIGENSWQVRKDALHSLKWLGIKLDEKTNRDCSSDGIISATDSTIKAAVIKTREDWMIAKEGMRFFQQD